MLTKFIRELFEPLIEGVLWLSLLGAFIAGAYANGVPGVLVALLTWLLMSILFIGLALIIVDIRNIVKKIEERQSHREAEN